MPHAAQVAAEAAGVSRAPTCFSLMDRARSLGGRRHLKGQPVLDDEGAVGNEEDQIAVGDYDTVATLARSTFGFISERPLNAVT